MNALGWLVLGLLAGWVIEFVIDYQYWRKKARLEADRLAQRESAIDAEQTEMGQRKAALKLREREMADFQSSLASRDAELLQAAQRIEERADDLGRLEQATEKRRAEIDRIGLNLNEREKEISGRADQLRSKEGDYNRRLHALETTEQELARRVAVVGNREEAMQSWEGRILSREHDVADREASVNYHAARIAADAGAFDAAKHLLDLHQRPDGVDNLQSLMGIDAATAELLKDAGIDSFERLSETPLGELTRVLQRGGPKFALVDPLSWPEQAAYVLDKDYVALDRLQSRLKGIERESVGDVLLAAMSKKSGKPATPGADAGADSATPSDSASAEGAAGQVPGSVLAGAAAGVATGAALGADAALAADAGQTAADEESRPLAGVAGEAAAGAAAGAETAGADDASPDGAVLDDAAAAVASGVVLPDVEGKLDADDPTSAQEARLSAGADAVDAGAYADADASAGAPGAADGMDAAGVADAVDGAHADHAAVFADAAGAVSAATGSTLNGEQRGAAGVDHADAGHDAAGDAVAATVAGVSDAVAQAEALLGEPTDERSPVMWDDDSGDGAEGSDVHVAIERVQADPVDEGAHPWSRGGADEVSDAQVLSERPLNR
ncbi:MAG: hypothetical protein Q4D19_02290 [Lautropia sp.]|nr:hypothetical protein [Lautropia sp.]